MCTLNSIEMNRMPRTADSNEPLMKCKLVLFGTNKGTFFLSLFNYNDCRCLNVCIHTAPVYTTNARFDDKFNVEYVIRAAVKPQVFVTENHRKTIQFEQFLRLASWWWTCTNSQFILTMLICLNERIARQQIKQNVSHIWIWIRPFSSMFLAVLLSNYWWLYEAIFFISSIPTLWLFKYYRNQFTKCLEVCVPWPMFIYIYSMCLSTDMYWARSWTWHGRRRLQYIVYTIFFLSFISNIVVFNFTIAIKHVKCMYLYSISCNTPLYSLYVVCAVCRELHNIQYMAYTL